MENQSKRGNPYDWIGPVVDSALFAGREEELKTIEDEIARLNKVFQDFTKEGGWAKPEFVPSFDVGNRKLDSIKKRGGGKTLWMR